MAGEQGDLQLKITLDDGSIVDGFLSVEKKAKQTADKVSDDFGGGIGAIGEKVKGLALAFAAAFTVGKVVGFLKDSARAAMEAERATNQLSASLALLGKYSDEAVDSFDKFAGNLQKTTGISDDFIKENAAMLVSIGKLSGEGLERATEAALNMAAALQIDAGSAFDLIAKAASGNTASLGRYGLKIDETIPKAQKFATVLEMVETRFNGLAAANLNTLEGAFKNLGNAFGEIPEALGKFITESPTLRVTINETAKSFYSLAESIDEMRKSSGDIFAPLIKHSIEFGLVINEFLIKPLELGFNLLNTGFRTVIWIINTLIANFFQINTVINKYLLEPLLNVFGFIAEKIVSLVNENLGKKIGDSVKMFGAQMTQGAQEMEAGPVAMMNASFNSMADAAENTFVSRMGGSIGEWLTNLKSAVNEADGVTKQYKNNTDANLTAVSDAFKDHLKAVNSSFSQGLVNAVSAGAQNIGKALAKGTFSAEDFGNTILSIFGDLAIQLGTLMISYGIGINALAASLASFNGFGAIAAGVALIAIGAAIKSLSTKDSASNAGVAGGGVAASPSPSTDLTQQDDIQKAEQQPTISVVIQGDVLDSDESGSRIIDLINKTFDRKGNVLNQLAVQ